MSFFRTLSAWILNRFMDYVFPPIAFVALLVWAPMYFTWNTFIQFVRSFLGPSSLSDKVVVITGASSGIGEQVAYELARKNAKLVLAARREEKLESVAEQCKRLGAQAADSVNADTGGEEGCRAIVEHTITKYGKMDILVLNAGVGQAFLFEHVESPAALRNTVDIDFWGYVYATLYALPYLKKTNGTIVVNSSIAGFTPFARHSIYCAAKAMVTQFFDTLRVEIRDEVHITIVFPGPVASELTAGKVVKEHGKLELDQERRDELLGPQPMVETETCAKELVKAGLMRKRYRIIPKWAYMNLMYHIFAPEILFFFLHFGQIASEPDQPPRTKKSLDQIGGQKFLFKPPTQTPEQAKEAMAAKAT